MLLVLVDVEALVALLAAAVPSDVALPNSTKSTVAPFAPIPMKLPTRGVAVPETPLLLVLVPVLWALLARALVVGVLKLPVQPCVPSVLL